MKLNIDFQIRETFESALLLGREALIRLGVAQVEADEVVTAIRQLDQERLNEEVLHGFSAELVKKYWTPKPFVRPTQHAEALNEGAADILSQKEETGLEELNGGK